MHKDIDHNTIGTSPNSNMNADLIVVTVVIVSCVTTILIMLAIIAILSIVLIRKSQLGLLRTEHE